MFYRYTKFGVSRFSRSKDMIAGIEIKMGYGLALATVNLPAKS